MKSVEIKHIKAKYKSLEIGEVFLIENKGTYIVTDTKDEHGMQFAVNLGNGALTHIGAYEEVIVAQNVIVEV